MVKEIVELKENLKRDNINLENLKQNLKKDSEMDKTLENLINLNKMGDFYNKIEELKNNETDSKLMDDIHEVYNNQTKLKIEIGKKKYDNLEKLQLKEKELNTKQQVVKQLKTKDRSLKKKIQQEIYNEKDTKDYNELYKIITGIHFTVLLLVLLACIFPIINNMIVAIVTIFMYIIMMGIILIKFKKDEKRDINDYNTFNMENENKSCIIKRK